MPANSPSKRFLLRQWSKRISRPVGDLAVVVVLSSTWLLFWDRLFEALLKTHRSSLSLSEGFSLWGGHVASESAIALCFTLILGASILVEHLFGRRVRAGWAEGIFCGAVALWPFFSAGSALSGGNWISRQPYAIFIAPALAVIGAGLFASAGALRRSTRPRLRALFAAGCGAMAILSLLCDALIFPEIYPAFHRLAFGVSAVFSFLLCDYLTPRLVPARHPTGRALLCAGALLLAALSLYSFSTLSQARRAELLVKSRTVGYVMTLTPRPKKTDRLGPVLQRVAKGEPVSFDMPAEPHGQLVVPKDWNIILIIVDAMRADTLPPARHPGLAHAVDGDTPFLDKWMSDTYRFQYAYAPADITHVSMPSIFRGLTPPELLRTAGAPLSVQMARLGRTPISVVNKLFLSPTQKKLSGLLAGFESKWLYPDKKQESALRTMLDAVDKSGKKPFFGWFHFYCLHNPYFAQGGIQKESTGSFPERYRRALRWLDKRLQQLFAGFDKRGITEKTIFILTADHGEGLGDRRLKTHGSYVFDEETRVPFYIRIPRRPGALIPQTVGLIDLSATLTDLLGAPKKSKAGMSLVPLLVSPGAKWNRDYYLQNSLGNHMGVVRGRDKLIYFKDTDTLFRYDLASDSREKKNLYNKEGALDQILLSRLVFHQPGLFVDELEDPATRALFDRLYKNVNTMRSADAARLVRRVAEAAAAATARKPN